MNPSKKIIFSIFLAAILGAIIWTEALLYSQHKLNDNQYWTLHSSSYSSWNWVEGLLTRTTLAGNKLGSSHQPSRKRLVTKSLFLPKKISFKFSLSHNGHATLFFPFEDRTIGVRLSRNEFYPSMIYESDSSGKYLKKVPLNINQFQAQGLDADLEHENSVLTVKIGEAVLGKFKAPLKPTIVGIEVNQNAEISQVQVTETSGIKADLTFRDREGFFKFFTANLFLMALILALTWQVTKKLYLILKLSFILVVTGILWLGADYWYFSKVPVIFDVHRFETRSRDDSIGLNLEGLRYRFFGTWYKILGGHVTNRDDFFRRHGPLAKRFDLLQCLDYDCETLTNEAQAKEEALRIVLLSEHSFNGIGADKIQHTFHVQLQKKLMENLQRPLRLQTFNYIHHDIRSRFTEALRNCETLRPHYLFISWHYSHLPQDLMKEFINNVIGKGIKVVYLYEVLNPEKFVHLAKLEELQEFKKQRRLRKEKQGQPVFNQGEVGVSFRTFFSDHQISLIDPNDRMLLSAILESGMIWQDPVFLTAHGQKVVSEIVADELVTLFREDGQFGKFFK
jgi:hypothetical protein